MLDFAITGLPRSRTAWMAAYFTTGSTHCWHEWSANVNEPADFAKARVPNRICGVSDTAIWLLGDDLPKHVRRMAIIHRPVADCEASLRARFGVSVDLSGIDERLRELPGLHVHYHDLSKVETMRSGWEYCTQTPFQPERYELFRTLHIETNVDYFGKPIESQWLMREVKKCRL